MADDNFPIKSYQDDLDTDPSKTDPASETHDLTEASGIPEDKLAQEFKTYALDGNERDASPDPGGREISAEDAREHLEDMDENDAVGSNQE